MEPLVDRLLADTRRELAAIERQPLARRFERMLLLALEREQTAAVAYSEKMVADRIAHLPVDEATREAVRRVVLWVHRDEALHAQYLRGRLLQTRKAKPAAVAPAIQPPLPRATCPAAAGVSSSPIVAVVPRPSVPCALRPQQ